MIKLIDEICVTKKEERHFKIEINGKEVDVSKWSEYDEFGCDGDTEIFKTSDGLTEEEQEEVLAFVNDL